MKKTLLALAIPVGLSLAMVSCKKDTPTPTPTPAPSSSAPPTPMVGGEGALVSLRVGTTTIAAGQTFVVDIETAVAAFYNGTNTSTFLDGGTVKVNSNELTKNENNSYVYSSTTKLDLDFDGGSNWSVTGAGNVPAISYNHTNTFPNYTGTLPTTITKSEGFSLDLTGKVTGADSVYVFVASGDKSFIKHLGPNPGNVTISATDIADLALSTTGFVEVIPFNYRIETISGKQIAFVKEYAAVSTVEIK